jgi:tRNA (mo5U34)-methyltransferase
VRLGEAEDQQQRGEREAQAGRHQVAPHLQAGPLDRQTGVVDHQRPREPGGTEHERRGADRVLGIDSDAEYLAQARFAAEVSGLEIEFQELSVYDVASLAEKFEIVLFMGVLYHLRHPLLALDLIHEHVSRDLLVFQSLQRGSMEVDAVDKDYPFWRTDHFDKPAYPKLHFVEQRYAGDPTNWWIPNRACVEAMLRSAGFEITAHPEEEVYICRHVPTPQEGNAVCPARGQKA